MAGGLWVRVPGWIAEVGAQMVEDCEGYGGAVGFIMGSWVSETAYLCLESGQRIPVVETFSVFEN